MINPLRSTNGIRTLMSFFKKNTDAVRRLRHQPTSTKADRFGGKKRNDIRKALGRDWRFSRSLKTEELSKKSTSVFLKMEGGGKAKKRP